MLLFHSLLAFPFPLACEEVEKAKKILRRPRRIGLVQPAFPIEACKKQKSALLHFHGEIQFLCDWENIWFSTKVQFCQDIQVTSAASANYMSVVFSCTVPLWISDYTLPMYIRTKRGQHISESVIEYTKKSTSVAKEQKNQQRERILTVFKAFNWL